MKMKRVLIGVIVLVLAVLQPVLAVSVKADDVNTEAVPPEEKTPEQLAAEEAARKQAAYDAPVDSNALANWPTGPQVFAASAVVMDMESGAILYAKAPDEKRFPASITKLMTTLVALENAELTDTVTFSQASVDFLNWDDAHIGMKPGEQISMNDALYAVLLASANEVSYAVAESTGINRMGGDYQTFIDEMNRRARELGCTGSNWVNPNGLHDENHYTTAHDMALIASAVYQKEQFRTIMGTLEYRIGKTNITDEERVFQQNHKMLWPENYYYYEYCKGGKTGFTDQSGTTLVTMADNGQMRLAAVVLKDYGVDAYVDTRAMLDYVFGNFVKVPLDGQEIPEEAESFQDANSYVVLPAGVSFSEVECNLVPDMTEGESARLADAVYTYQGQHVGSAKVLLKEKPKEEVKKKQSDEQQKRSKTEMEEKKHAVMIGLAAVAVAAAVGSLWLSRILYRKEQQKKRLKKHRRHRKP